MGLNPGPIDGQYGPQTLNAVRSYQQQHGLAPDGIYGPQTAAALSAAGAPEGGAVQPQAQAPEATALINPEEDPQFLAFQRAMGYNENDLRAQVAMKRSRAAEDFANQLPILAEENRSAVQGINGDYESRGIGGGGQNKLDLLRQRTDYSRQQGLLRQGLNRTVGDLGSDLSRQVAQNRIQTSEEELNARKRLAERNAQTRGLQ